MYGYPESVVRAYQKFIYASADEQERLLLEYNILKQLSGTTQPVFRETTMMQSEGFMQGGFDSELIPETTTVYPAQGAKIYLFRILDIENQSVNVLIQGQEYLIEISGQFLLDTNCVYFGTHIRSISGLEITGQIYPEQGKYIEHMSAGDKFRITYRFKMILLPGTYFVGGGIWSCSEPNCLHRIVDALLFRVLPNRKINSFGLVDALSAEPAFEFFSCGQIESDKLGF
jgi:lipopolysaccharide transport system ATP-binding protein